MFKVPVTLTDEEGSPVVFTGPCTLREVRLNSVPARSIVYVHPQGEKGIAVRQGLGEIRQAFAAAMTGDRYGSDLLDRHDSFNLHKKAA